LRLRNKIAIVTGGGRGIGLAVALAVVREGARVIICDANSSLLNGALSEIKALGGHGFACHMDVTNKKQINNVVIDALNRFGKIDILVNSAGIYEILPIEEITEEKWDRVLAVNLKGVFLCSQAVIGPMKRQRSGCVVNMASSAGKTGGVLAGAHYSASKAGIICFTKSLAREVASYGITVNAVAPGRIDTPMIRSASDQENENVRRVTPSGRLGKPEDVANAVVFLVSNEASFITGEILDVNGGLLMD